MRTYMTKGRSDRNIPRTGREKGQSDIGGERKGVEQDLVKIFVSKSATDGPCTQAENPLLLLLRSSLGICVWYRTED